MSWITRESGKRFFYLSRRRNGRVTSIYLGRGEAALVETMRVEQRQRVLDQLRRESQSLALAERALREHSRDTRDCVTCLMAIAGYGNQRSRGWRKAKMAQAKTKTNTNIKTKSKPGKGSKAIAQRTFHELMLDARKGDASAVPALRAALLEDPSLMRANGQVACRTQTLWIDRIAGNDLFRRECLLITTAKLKHDLMAESGGTVVESMMVELAISTWLQLFYHEQKEASDPASNLDLGEYRLKKIESAFNRHMRVLGSLTALRAVRFPERMADMMTVVAGQEQAKDPAVSKRQRRQPVNRLEAVLHN